MTMKTNHIRWKRNVLRRLFQVKMIMDTKVMMKLRWEGPFTSKISIVRNKKIALEVMQAWKLKRTAHPKLMIKNDLYKIEIMHMFLYRARFLIFFNLQYFIITL
jgi:hypothetical protein